MYVSAVTSNRTRCPAPFPPGIQVEAPVTFRLTFHRSPETLIPNLQIETSQKLPDLPGRP